MLFTSLLNGKDYLTVEESCEFMCISETTFRKIRKRADLQPLPGYPKVVFALHDLRYIMQHANEYDLVNLD